MSSNLNSLTVNGTVVQLNPNNSKIELDLALRIHRFDAPLNSQVYISFLYPSTSSSLRVLIKADLRPDYEMMLKESVLISQKVPHYRLTQYKIVKPTFLYLAILPGTEVLINQSVKYSFQVNSTFCQFWERGQWSNEGCQITPDTVGKIVKCQCSHFSVFGAAFIVPPVDIDPFADIGLFLTVFDNPLVVAFVSALLLIYAILCVWARYEDNNDVKRSRIIVLDDNFPGDMYPCLIAVYTGLRLGSGTSANVVLRLNGNNSSSRAHLLRSRERKVLKTNCDDWFLIYCPRILGELKSIHIWHDNSGFCPDWFCVKIHVYDLPDNTETVFIVEKWLAMTLDEYPEAELTPSSRTDIMNAKRVLIDNCFLGFRESHFITSIALKHPRSYVTRLQRISVLMCCVMVAMLCNIMFFKPDDESYTVDDYVYGINLKEIYISTVSLVLAITVTMVLMYFFRKSYKQQALVISKDLAVRAKDKSVDLYFSNLTTDSTSVISDNAVQDKQRHGKLVSLVKKFAKAPSLAPVGLKTSNSGGEVNKIWFKIAWGLSLTVIILCAYLVMLYGLRLGYIKSLKWLSAVFMTVGGEVLVTGPVKIILVSAILSFIFKKSLVVDLYRLDSETLDSAKPPFDDEYAKSLIPNRSRKVYRPLNFNERVHFLNKLRFKAKAVLFMDFLLTLFFVIFVSAIIFREWTPKYFTNKHVNELVKQAHHPHLGSIHLSHVKNISDMEMFLDNTFVIALYNMRWYNGEFFEEKTIWSADFTHRMIGQPMIRQQRVVIVNCSDLNQEYMNCVPPFSKDTEDRNVYGFGWSPLALNNNATTNSAWKYTKNNKTFIFTLYRLYGASGKLYDTGGFMMIMGLTKTQTVQILGDLIMNSWLDVRTRVMFLDLTLYNVNENVFSEATVIVEYLVSGTLLIQVHVTSMKYREHLSVWEVLFVCFAFFRLLKSCLLINYQGFFKYTSEIRNVIHLIIVGMSFLVITLINIHHSTSVNYFKWFQKTERPAHFDFDEFVFYYLKLKVVISILLGISILDCFFSLKGGRWFLNFYYIFTLSLKWIIWLSGVTALSLFFLHQIAITLNLYLYRVKELVFNHGSTMSTPITDLEHNHVKIFLIITFIRASIATSCFIVSFLQFTKTAKVHKL